MTNKPIKYMLKRENKKIEKVKLNKESLKKALKIFQYLKPYKSTYLIGLIFLLLSSFASLIFPMFIGEMIDATKKSIDKVKVVINGAGASAMACANLFKKSGVPQKNITMVDRTGGIYSGRETLNQWI